MKKLLLVLSVLLILSLAGCEQKNICEKPNIPTDSGCCLDNNNNLICDVDEIKEIKEKEVVIEKEVEVIEETDDQFSNAEGLHWTHMPITYQITNEDECGGYESRKIQRAFKEVEEATNGVVNFKKIDEPADIDVKCTFIHDCYKSWVDVPEVGNYIYLYESICEHTAGLAQLTEIEGNKIRKAEIELIGLGGFAETGRRNGEMSGFFVGSCGNTNTEIHEILHTFRYGHVNDTKSVMYLSEELISYTIQKKGSCIGSKKGVDISIAKDLIKKYTIYT